MIRTNEVNNNIYVCRKFFCSTILNALNYINCKQNNELVF